MNRFSQKPVANRGANDARAPGRLSSAAEADSLQLRIVETACPAGRNREIQNTVAEKFARLRKELDEQQVALVPECHSRLLPLRLISMRIPNTQRTRSI